MPMKFYALLGLLCLNTIAFAQNWDYYTPFQASGPVPGDFTDVYVNKYQRGVQTISKNENRKSRRRKDDFYRKSEYFINEYLVSGNVFFGDTITNYCQSIVNNLIGDDKTLKEQIRVYSVKSPVVNATATASGIIFVNTGLIAQLETEAQLAYILSHELTHYTENHVLDQYIEREEVLNGENAYRKSSYDEKMLALSTYSKSQELEADKKGYTRFYSNLPYNPSAPHEVLDILQYAELPFDEFAFPKDFFDTQYLVFPADYHLEETAPITAAADYDDKGSTHPNLENRREALGGVIPKNAEGSNFLISEDAFRYCRKIARYEQSRLYLLQRQYPLAIYNSFLLLRNDPHNRYLRLTIAKALQAMLVYHNERDLYKVVEDLEDVEGSSQELYYFFDKLSRNEMATLAVSYSYELKREFPEDPAIARLFDKCLHELVMETELKTADFEKSLPDTSDTEVAEDTLNYRANTKVGRIRQKNTEESLSEKAFYQYAFVGFFQDSVFANAFEEKEAIKANTAYYKPQDRYNKRDKFDKNAALGLEKVVCVTPQYLKLDQRDKDGIKFIATDERLARFRQYIQEIAGKVDLELQMLDYKGNAEFDALQFNDIALLTSWLQERLSHVNHKVLNSDFDYVNNIIERYGTPYVITTGNVSLKVDENVLSPILLSIILPPYAPFALMDLSTQDYESFNYFFAFDLRDANALLAEYNYYQSSDSKDYIRSIIYNSLLQVSDKPKKQTR